VSDGSSVRVVSPAIGIDTSERLQRLGRAGLGAALGVAAALAVATGLSLVASAFLLWLPVYAAGVGSLAALAAAASRRRTRTSPGAVEIHDGTLFVTPHDAAAVFAPQAIPTTSIAQGWEAPFEVRFAVPGGRVIAVRTQGAAESDSLLRAAGVSASMRALRVPLATAAARSPGGVGLIAAALGTVAVVAFVELHALAGQIAARLRDPLAGGGAARHAIVLAGCAIAAFVVAAALRRREAVVGTDGILVRETLRERLIRYTDLERALPDTRGVMLHRKDGGRVLLPTLGAEESPLRPRLPGPAEPLTDAEARRSALLGRIEQAMSASAHGAAVWASLDQLDRKGRPLAAWREDLGRVLARAADYRNVGLGPADLAGVMEDATAPRERRIAAAVALSAAQPEEARKRARIAADACADEDLRRALERAAEGEIDEELLEEDERRATRTP
jgi:hypothetical protein